MGMFPKLFMKMHLGIAAAGAISFTLAILFPTTCEESHYASFM